MKGMRLKHEQTVAQSSRVVENADPGVANNLASRLDLLKLRTTALGMIAATAVGIGVFLLLENGQQLLESLRTVEGAKGLPTFHVPSGLVSAPQAGSTSLRVGMVVQFALLFVWVAGVWGLSTKRLVGLKRLGWLTLLVILAAFTLRTKFIENSLGGISESALRRAIAEQHWDAAEQLVQIAPESILRTYVFAQIALHAGDRQGLLRFGQPLVDTVDAALMDTDPLNAATALMQLKEVRPEVVYALEMALYGAPRTSVGIALFKQQATPKGLRIPSHLSLWGFAASSTLLAISGMGLWLWLQMLRRIQRLHDWLHQGATRFGAP